MGVDLADAGAEAEPDGSGRRRCVERAAEMEGGAGADADRIGRPQRQLGARLRGVRLHGRRHCRAPDGEVARGPVDGIAKIRLSE